MRKINVYIRLTLLVILFSGIATRPVQATDAIVGDGTPASCTEEEFDNKLATVLASGSGTLTFNCGGAATINFDTGKVITGGTFTIDGGDQITLSGVSKVRHFYIVAEADFTLKNITLTNGFDNTYGGGSILSLGALTLNNTTIQNSNVDTSHSGGAIMSLDAPVTIIDSLIENNTGGSAGGLYLLGENADATITGSTFRNNRTTSTTYGFGGAISIWNGAEATIEGSTLEQNHANNGGGVYVNDGAVTIHNSNFHQNTAEYDGGGMVNTVTTTVTLSSVTFSDNMAMGNGGAIADFGSVGPSWDDLIVDNNQAANGGGIYLNGRAVVIHNATIINNQATFIGGGGIYTTGSNLQLEGSFLKSNTANYPNSGLGGGAYFVDGITSIIDTTIDSNVSVTNGGGIQHNDGTLNVVRSTFSGNLSPLGFGGGLSSQSGLSGIVHLTNVTFSQNGAPSGGGLFLENIHEATLNYVTFYDNEAIAYSISGLVMYESSATMKNVVLQSEQVNNCEFHGGSFITSAGFNLTSDSSCNLTGTGDQENVDALLGPLNDNGGPTLTHLPRLGSPALDSGQCVAGISNDQRNVSRPQGAACDIGAVERTPDDVDSFFLFLPVVIR